MGLIKGARPPGLEAAASVVRRRVRLHFCGASGKPQAELVPGGSKSFLTTSFLR